jgi:hypothetical protein
MRGGISSSKFLIELAKIWIGSFLTVLGCFSLLLLGDGQNLRKVIEGAAFYGTLIAVILSISYFGKLRK